jgi:hypothetical protein
MSKKRILRIVCGWSSVMVIALGMSYCSEATKHRFEDRAAESTSGVPGARVISSERHRSILSPVSWLWAATTQTTIALPDPRVADRFYTMTLAYGEKLPVVFLVDADCQTRKLTFFGPDEPEGAAPAQDLFGAPIVAANGKTYRRLRTDPEAPATWIVDFCDTDWSVERDTVAAARRSRPR